MSDIVKTFVLLAILGVAIFLDVQLDFYLNKHKTQQIIEQQSTIIEQQNKINQQLNDRINELQETVEYVEFSLEVNNKMLEEIILEQMKSN